MNQKKYVPKKGDLVTYNNRPCRVMFDEDDDSSTCSLQWLREAPGAGQFWDVHTSRVKLKGDTSGFVVTAPC